MIRFFAMALAVLLSFSPAVDAAPVKAQPGLGIAAILDGEAISSYDVDARLRFVIATTNLSNTPEVIERIRPQVIRSLVDERLQLRAAKSLNIEISDEEVSKTIAALEQQRGMPPGAISKMLVQNRVPKDTFTNQIRAQLAWNRLVVKKLRSQVKITDEEVALAQKKLAIPVVKQELEIAVLTLPVDKPAREPEVRKLVEKLLGEMRAGASFEEVSRQFASTANAGQIVKFWVRPEQLDPALGKALVQAKANSITPPLRTQEGYTMVKVYNTRALANAPEKDQELRLKSIVLKLRRDASNKEAEALLSIGEEVARHPGSCAEEGVAGVEELKDLDIEANMQTVRMSALSPAVRAIVQGLNIDEISAPFATDQGIQLYMLCERKDVSGEVMDPERVKNIIYQQKIELEAQKYLRNLRRDAYIEVR